MGVSVAALRRYREAKQLDAPEARDRAIRRRIFAVWGLLYLNTLTYVPGGLLPLPSKMGKVLTQGSLPLALLLVLTVNPKLRLRPNVFLLLVTLLAIDTVAGMLQLRYLGTVYRTFRLCEFVCVLWLLSPWWGRSDLLILRCHLRWLYVALGLVFVGLLAAPGRARAQNGRLSGIIWPMYPTQVAQYAAVAAGLTLVLWLGRMVSGRLALAGIMLATPILLLTHTRTALAALLVGTTVAGLSLFTINARVRRFFVTSAAFGSLIVLVAAGVATTWLARGEGTKGLTTLTGRTNFWALVLHQPRDTFQEIFGFGLSNASINGLPIDSNWLASYMMEGIVGVVVCAMILAFLFAAAFLQASGVPRALGLFLVTYCTLASVTEVGFADVSTYLLHVTVAASLLVMPLTGARRSA
jgi:hypothetical protein